MSEELPKFSEIREKMEELVLIIRNNYSNLLNEADRNNLTNIFT